MTYYVLTFMRVASRRVCIAGITTSPDQRWMEQMARNMGLADIGFLNGCRYLLHDRDAKFCAAFAGILEAVGIKAIKLPARSPNLNANLERWHRSVKEECLSKLILSVRPPCGKCSRSMWIIFIGKETIKARGM